MILGVWMSAACVSTHNLGVTKVALRLLLPCDLRQVISFLSVMAMK